MILSGLRILLAEDNPTNQLVAMQMLESLGASAALAEDGVEALGCIEREPFDAVLVDIEMPRLNGIEVIRHVRGMPGAVSETALIALTAYVMREHRAAIEAAGADGIIAKPITSIEQFGADIRRYMRSRAPARASAATGPAAGPSAGSGSGAAPDPIDRGIYHELARAIGPAAMSELLERADSDLRDARARLERALDPLDLDEIRAVTHILISIAGAVGAVALQDQAGRMNRAAHGNDPGALVAGCRRLAEMIAGVLDFIGQQARG
jgi:CheY-like chemotaxis protein